MKLSEEVVKSTLPGKKRVWRIFENGNFIKDIISLDEEVVDNARPLLEQAVKSGKIIYVSPSLEKIRQKAAENFSHLPDKYKKLDGAPVYPVEFSIKLKALRERIVEKIKREEINA